MALSHYFVPWPHGSSRSILTTFHTEDVEKVSKLPDVVGKEDKLTRWLWVHMYITVEYHHFRPVPTTRTFNIVDIWEDHGS